MNFLVLVKHYKSYINPVILYGILVYGCTTKTTLDPVFKLQKKLIRIIFNKKRDFHSEILFEKANVPNIYDLYSRELMKFSLLAAIKNTSSYTVTNLIHLNEAHVKTRKACQGMFSIPTIKKNVQKRSLSYRGCKVLNYLLEKELISKRIIGQSERQINYLVRKLKVNYKELSEILFN